MGLEAEAKKLVAYIRLLKSSGKFQIKLKGPPSEGPADEHIGAVIVDATLSARHHYKTQVEPIVTNLRNKYPKGKTTSGFLDLMNSVGLEDLLMGWEKKSTEKLKQIQVRETAQFFADQDVKTFSDLAAWIKQESNRQELKKEVYGIGDKTADYYGVLTGDPDAVAIDVRISIFLSNAGIDTNNYNYKEKRTIVQLAAIQLGKRPLDLEQSIWDYNPKRKQKGGEMANGALKQVYMWEFARQNGAKWIMDAIDQMKEKYKPQGWDADTLRYARKGEFVKIFREELGPSWRSQFEKLEIEGKAHGSLSDDWLKTDEKARKGFEDTPDGKQWLEEFKRKQNEQVLVQLCVRLLPGKMAQLQKIADDSGTNARALAKIWILEHLCSHTKIEI